MNYFLNYKNDKCIGGSNVKLINDEFKCLEVTKEEYEEFQKQQENKQARINQINELKLYLSSTDYICNKLTEALAFGDIEKLEELKTKYAEILIEREKTRILIDELEKLDVC